MHPNVSRPDSHPYMSTPFVKQDTSVECYCNDTFYIDRCVLGWGMFANRSILKNEIIFVFSGPIIDFAETKRRGQWECMPIQTNCDEYIDTLAPGVFVNHSCEPNSGIRNDRELIALRDLTKGDEIRFDYSTTMEERSFSMECLCGAHNCRHIVEDFSTLPLWLQQRYITSGVVMGFILRMAFSATRLGSLTESAPPHCQ